MKMKTAWSVKQLHMVKISFDLSKLKKKKEKQETIK